MERTLLLGMLVTVGACANLPPNATPDPRPVATIGLRAGWQSTVIAERVDSISLTLPSGERQLQHSAQRAAFTLTVAANGVVTAHLDSTTSTPPDSGDGAPDVLALSRRLAPHLPARGAEPQSNWADSASEMARTGVFTVKERRTVRWSAGLQRDRMVPVKARDDFEQVGGGQRYSTPMTYTSQGSRSDIYYVKTDGTISSATLVDSVAMTIGFPGSKEVVSGTRVSRTAISFIPMRGD